MHEPQEQEVNYYPSYKVYLFADPSNGITAANIQPREGENTHYSIFGISAHSNLYDYDSKISAPNPMYAVRIEKPVKPEDVKGPLYATRPDFLTDLHTPLRPDIRTNLTECCITEQMIRPY